jgi:hypothetical protein
MTLVACSIFAFFALGCEEPKTPAMTTYEEANFFLSASNLGCRRYKIAALKFLSLGKFSDAAWQTRDNSEKYVSCLEEHNNIKNHLLVKLINQFYLNYCLPISDGECAKNKGVSLDDFAKLMPIIDEIEQFLFLVQRDDKIKIKAPNFQPGLAQAIRDWKIANEALIREDYSESAIYLDKIHAIYLDNIIKIDKSSVYLLNINDSEQLYNHNYSPLQDKIDIFQKLAKNELEYQEVIKAFQPILTAIPEISFRPEKKTIICPKY